MTSGAVRFARYAFPPNELGYCGPASAPLLELASAGHDDRELRHLASGFDGAWPYLQMIASATGRDPLDPAVVEAYWLGNDLLSRVPMQATGRSIEDRFRSRAGRGWAQLAAAIPLGAVPHHSFHVFAVYPWLDLLRQGKPTEPLRILDRCRIRSGVVNAIFGDIAIVQSQPLVWDGRSLSLGAPITEEVVVAAGGHTLAGPVAPGDHVTMHWNWICERATPQAAAELERWNRSQMLLVNGQSRPGTVEVLG